ncbi:MAG: metalloregulator ArsR/SmtB family transcription factor [Deltaproteobacteria bacterium]|nr:metalloregulator ArsR/SmtB family transcription factor [Myxococcales bacterium]MDP3220843.1 metalloregulator ArsR/SmtB family transcription factor [Deltaproteobacteria bacterium]
MVADQLTPEQADRVFHALADRTRRDIVRSVLGGEASVSALGRQYPMSLAAVQKHVAVLERAGLVTKTRRGREQIVRADLDPLRRAAQLFEHLEALWRGRVDRMGELLAEPQKGPSR